MATTTDIVAPAAGQRATQVRVHLQSRSDDMQLPQDTGAILVSTEFRRYQLSTLVNRLLETEQPIPLEFLINGQFLRTSLDDFLTQNGISAETTLTVEYVKALIPPQHIASYEQDDWISSVDVLSSSSRSSNGATVSSRILSGSYDGLVRVWNMSNEVVATGQGHTSSIKCAKFISPTQIVTSSRDRTLRLWKYTDSETGQGVLAPTLELYGHRDVVDRVAVHSPSSRMLSASFDTSVGIWSTRKSDAPVAPDNLLPSANPANKRRKLADASTAKRGALALLTGHERPVSDVVFDDTDASVAYSAAQDHCVKTWDLATQRCVDTRRTTQALFALCHLPAHSLLATGGAARTIALVDPRASATSVSVMTLRGHTNAVNALARDPRTDHQFVSASNDGTCRIWDIRAARVEAGAERVGESVFVMDRFTATPGGPARALQGDESRVFSVCWDADVGIVSGGRDKKIHVHKAAS